MDFFHLPLDKQFQRQRIFRDEHLIPQWYKQKLMLPQWKTISYTLLPWNPPPRKTQTHMQRCSSQHCFNSKIIDTQIMKRMIKYSNTTVWNSGQCVQYKEWCDHVWSYMYDRFRLGYWVGLAQRDSLSSFEKFSLWEEKKFNSTLKIIIFHRYFPKCNPFLFL